MADEVNDAEVYHRLRLFNAFMGGLHLVQFGLMLSLSNNFSLPITINYQIFDTATQTLSLTTDTLTYLRIGPLVALFLLISSVAHFTLASPWGFPWYVRNLKRHINYLRWYEYAISSSIMIVVIAMLTGVQELALLLTLFAINACMNLFGLMMELHNQTIISTNWTSYYFGVFAGLIPWIVIGIYLGGATLAAQGEIPNFVYAIYVSIAFFFNIFAINMILQYKQIGKWENYLHGERVYILLSLIAKSALAWQIFAGTLRPI